jgi:16S rRNA (guanine966-N2)-methyltransferase
VGQGLGPSMAKWDVHCREVCRWLAAAGQEGFDLIYADPPYAGGLYPAIAAKVAAGSWLRPDGTLVFECASKAMPAIPDGWQLADQRTYGSTGLLLLNQP